jgi:hypothetical protein
LSLVLSQNFNFFTLKEKWLWTVVLLEVKIPTCQTEHVILEVKIPTCKTEHVIPEVKVPTCQTEHGIQKVKVCIYKTQLSAVHTNVDTYTQTHIHTLYHKWDIIISAW